MQKIKCRVCKKNKADFMDYNICEQCEIKNMKTKNIKAWCVIDEEGVLRPLAGLWLEKDKQEADEFSNYNKNNGVSICLVEISLI